MLNLDALSGPGREGGWGGGGEGERKGKDYAIDGEKVRMIEQEGGREKERNTEQTTCPHTCTTICDLRKSHDQIFCTKLIAKGEASTGRETS